MNTLELVLCLGGIVGLGLISGGVLRYLRLRKRIDYKYYGGKFVFDSLAEYAKFKCAIGSAQVTCYSADVLSSEPPIVVQFGASVTPDGIFPYGKEDVHYKSEYDVHAFGMFLMGGIILVSVIVLRVGNLFL